MPKPPSPSFAALLAAVAATALLAGGCGPRAGGVVPSPSSRPSLQKTLVSEEQGRDRFRQAAAETRAYLVHHPEDAEAHLELGILLVDALAQYPEAVFHLQTFLDANPRSEKAEVARSYIADVEQRLSGGGNSRPGTSGDETISPRELELVEHIEELNRSMAALRADYAAMSNRVAELEQENLKNVAEIARKQHQIDLLRKGGDATPSPRRPSSALTTRTLGDPVPATRPPSPSSSPANRRGTWTVQKNDTLWGIASKVYGDPSRNVDIRRANPGKVGPNDALTEGDILILP